MVVELWVCAPIQRTSGDFQRWCSTISTSLMAMAFCESAHSDIRSAPNTLSTMHQVGTARRIALSTLFMALVAASMAFAIASAPLAPSRVIVADGPPGTAGDGNGKIGHVVAT
jgi:hypothetical protein